MPSTLEMPVAIQGFQIDGELRAVSPFYPMQTIVAPGVVCHAYEIVGETQRDLAVVRVAAGMRTPLQRVLLGDATTEGCVKGSGILEVDMAEQYRFGPEQPNTPVTLRPGHLVQWTAGEKGLAKRV